MRFEAKRWVSLLAMALMSAACDDSATGERAQDAAAALPDASGGLGQHAGSPTPASGAGADAALIPVTQGGPGGGAPHDAGGSAPTGPGAAAQDAGMITAPLDAGAAPDTGAGAIAEAGAALDACDRACLLAFVQGYIDALIAHDPSQLSVAANLRYTENGADAKLGETVWKTATALVPEARLDFADPVEGQVASQFVFNEGSSPVIYQVRLKVVAREIAEIETMAVRRQGAANGFFNAAAMRPEPVFLQEIEPAQRTSREELRSITELYLDYLEGKKKADQVPFDSGCKRYENGQVTARGMRSFSLQNWSFRVTRRILVIDEEAGITWGLFPFTQDPTTLVVGEAFKIIGGKIMMIQAVMANQPAKGWD
jgi:hypothetical protein